MKRKIFFNLLVGTNNPGKLREIMHLLPNRLRIYSPKKFKLKSPKENGKTFKENSLIKARFFSNNFWGLKIFFKTFCGGIDFFQMVLGGIDFFSFLTRFSPTRYAVLKMNGP